MAAGPWSLGMCAGESLDLHLHHWLRWWLLCLASKTGATWSSSSGEVGSFPFHGHLVTDEQMSLPLASYKLDRMQVQVVKKTLDIKVIPTLAVLLFETTQITISVATRGRQ